MNTKLIICLSFLIFFLSHQAFTQSKEVKIPAKNVVSVSGSSAFVWNTAVINYERLLGSPKKGFFKNYYLNLETGVFHSNSGFAPGGKGANGVLLGAGVVGLTGNRNGHFELGAGLFFNSETKITQNSDQYTESNFLLPEVKFGYRYQAEKGFVFKVGTGFPKVLYLGFGYSF